MQYFLDHNGIHPIVPEELRRFMTTRYLPTYPIDNLDIYDLIRYIAWVTYLYKKHTNLSFEATQAYKDWMFAPYTIKEYYYADLEPQIPRITLAWLAMQPYPNGLHQLNNKTTRITILLQFFCKFKLLFPDYTWPTYLKYLFELTDVDPIPIIMQTYRCMNQNLITNFPCQSIEEKADYLNWIVEHSDDIYPYWSIQRIKMWLQSAYPAYIQEGISWSLVGLATRKNISQEFSLKSSLERLRFAVWAMILYPNNEISVWQWNILNMPHPFNPEIPKLAVGLTAFIWRSTDEEWILSRDNVPICIGLYIQYTLNFIKKFGIPQWLQSILNRPTKYLNKSYEYGISELMYAISLVMANIPVLTDKDCRPFLRWYFTNPLNISEELFAAAWQLKAWRRLFQYSDPSLPCYGDSFLKKRVDGHIAVLGWAVSRSGVGEDCRSMYASLQDVGIFVSCIDITPLVPVDDITGDVDVTQLTSCANIICLAAQDIYRLWKNSPTQLWAGRYQIGVCPWELPIWPQDGQYCIEILDEIWCPSTFIVNAFAKCGKPVTFMPHAIIPPDPDGDLRDEFGISPETIVFLTAFDANASYIRKNPFAVVSAFNKAFSGKNLDVRLIVKTMNMDNYTSVWQKLQDMNKCGDKIIYIDEIYSSEKYARLLNTCDAFISLHRSEGFGRILAETMSIGKLLICSKFGGNTDFSTSETACLIEGRTIPVLKEDYIFSKDQFWYDANTDHAAVCMENFTKNPEKYTHLRTAGKKYIRKYHSCEAIGMRVLRRLRELGFITTTLGG